MIPWRTSVIGRTSHRVFTALISTLPHVVSLPLMQPSAPVTQSASHTRNATATIGRKGSSCRTIPTPGLPLRTCWADCQTTDIELLGLSAAGTLITLQVRSIPFKSSQANNSMHPVQLASATLLTPHHTTRGPIGQAWLVQPD
ncbi:hypothetical protein V8C86DRAFT_2747225 [Haematococcus lacustris]